MNKQPKTPHLNPSSTEPEGEKKFEQQRRKQAFGSFEGTPLPCLGQDTAVAGGTEHSAGANSSGRERTPELPPAW